jgi:hypothetical protein
MRTVRISLIVVLVIGLVMTIRPPSDSREVGAIPLADIEATMQEQGSAPGWARAMAVGVGFVLVLVRLRKS